MSKSKVLLVSLSLIIGVIIALVLRFPSQDNDTSIQNSDEDINEKQYEIVFEDYFVPAVTFKTYQENVNFLDLSSATLTGLSENKNQLSRLFPENDILLQGSVDEAYKYLELNPSVIAILPANKVDFRFKILKLDQIDFFSKNLDLSTYKLVIEEQKNLTEKQFLEIESKLSHNEKGYKISNFDRSKLTTMFAGGEIITGRGVDIMWLQRSGNNFKFLFDRVKDDIKDADLAVALMEHSYQGNPTPCSTCTAFLGDEALIPQLKELGFDLFSLAGNHIGDVGGVKAQERTIELLNQNSIQYTGGGPNISEASKPVTVELNDVKYSFLAADQIAYFFWAGENSYGSNRYNLKDLAGNLVIDKVKVKSDIAAAKAQSDYVIVYMSWGTEYTNSANESQKELAHLLIDEGVDLIVGSHPHWIQNMEVYNGKLIIYSLGNFIFDQTHTDPTREAIYVNLNFYDGQLSNVEIVPILTCGYHFGAKNLAYDLLDGKITYADVDSQDEKKACIWLQPKPLDQSHPKYKVILDRLFQYTNI